MLSEKNLKDLLIRSAQEQWAYPKVFDALKDIGVEHYETNVILQQVTYSGNGKNYLEKVSAEMITPSVDFTVAEIQAAIRRTQAKQTNYVQFLQEIAQAGVWNYRVDIDERTVSYMGKNGEKYVENVPVLQ